MNKLIVASLLALAPAAYSLPSAHAFNEALPEKAPEPATNPSNPAKIALGRQLYFDPRISRTGTVSCNTCHNVMAGGDDNRDFSAGIEGKLGGRSAPTVWNAAFLSVQFWDGRAPSLEEQAKGPMTNPVEMGMASHSVVIERLKSIPGYVSGFKAAFGGSAPITLDNAVKAIAAYERTLITPNSPYDRFVKGDKKALSAGAQRGMKLVQDIGCTTCHMGANLAGPTALPVGTGFFQKFPVFPDADIEKKYAFGKDPGRMEVTKKEADRNMWRVATWRNVAMTAPYFHNGSVKTLEEAVRVMAKLQLNKTPTEAEIKDIVEFLNALTGEFPKLEMPLLPPTPNRSLISG
jgi:cytochrome c peroxidase